MFVWLEQFCFLLLLIIVIVVIVIVIVLVVIVVIVISICLAPVVLLSTPPDQDCHQQHHLDHLKNIGSDVAVRVPL